MLENRKDTGYLSTETSNEMQKKSMVYSRSNASCKLFICRGSLALAFREAICIDPVGIHMYIDYEHEGG
jgi:hypothetical protein